MAAALSILIACTGIQFGQGINAMATGSTAQTTYLLADEKLSTGVRYTEEDVINYLGDNTSRQRINHLTIDPNDPGTKIMSKKSADSVYDRENVLTQAQEEVGKGKNVIAGINADSFDINIGSGVSRTLNVYNGCVLQSQPYDNYNKCDPTSDFYYKYQSILYIDTNGKLHIGPLNSNAHMTAGNLSADVTALNRLDFSYCVQNDCYRAFTACASSDHMLRYVNSSDKTSSAYSLPKTIRYAIIQIDPVNGSEFNGYVKAGQTYTGKVIQKINEDNFTINGTATEIGTKDEFKIPQNCIVVAGYTPLLSTSSGYSTSKAAQIENLSVGQAFTYRCDLYAGYGFSTNNNSGNLTGVTADDLRMDVVSALGDFNTLALGGEANTKNNNEVYNRSPQITSRTMVGVEANGTIHMLTVANKSVSMSDSTGTNYQQITAYMMNTLHCRDVLAMDGGGSTTMVARRAGDSGLSVVNYPSDGSQRLVGNSLLIVSTAAAAPGSTVSQIVLDQGVNLYANSSYPFHVKLTDQNGNPISTEGKRVYYAAVKGPIDANGVYTAPATPCTDTVTATVDGVSASVTVTVVDSVDNAKLTHGQLLMTQNSTQQFSLTGYTPAKQRVIIDPKLVSWSLSDQTFGTLFDGMLTVTAQEGKSIVTASFAGNTYTSAVYAGLAEQSIEDFENTSVNAYHVSGYLYGACGSQRGGQSNSGANDTYIGYVSKSDKNSLVKNGNHSLRITALTDNWTNRTKSGTMNIYPDWDVANSDIGWSEVQRAALEDQFTAIGMPKRFGLWVYSPDDNHDGISDNAGCMLTAYFLQNCPGSKVAGYDSQSCSILFANDINWVGWKWIETDIPQTWDMPIVFNWLSLTNPNKAVGTDGKNEIILDDLKFIYGTDKPTASVAGGTFSSAQTVALTCASEGATIRYTTDGSEPTSSTGNIYTIPIPVSSSMTVKAKAFKHGLSDSLTMTETYNISIPIPTYSVTVSGGSGSGQYAAGATVTIKAEIPDGKIFDRWLSASGVTFTDPYCATATFVMPAGEVNISASFKDAVTPPQSPAENPVQPANGNTDHIAQVIPNAVNPKTGNSATPFPLLLILGACSTLFLSAGVIMRKHKKAKK